MRFFLSHSSSDKDSYVRYVADKLGDRAIYDEYTFESGMITLDEIFRTMEISDIFVLFISDNALESKWVKKEIISSKRLLDSSQMRRFLPILIDRSVNHADVRIPSWIRDNYNLRYVSKPAVALRRIRTVFSQLAMAKHPQFDKRRTLFVGRNDELNEFERRIDDYTLPVPSVVFVSGLREVGRKTFLINALRKSNKIDLHYDPLRISLHQEDGIDGLISKIYDLGVYSGEFDVDTLGQIQSEKKIGVVVDMLTDVANQNEVLLVDDWRSIVRFGGELADWFLAMAERLPKNKLVLAIASAYAPAISKPSEHQGIYRLRLRELDAEERMGLLVRYLRDVAGRADVDVSELSAFRNVLNGYPEQAIYAGQLVADGGIKKTIDNMSDIVEFSSIKASVYVEKYRDNDDVTEFLTFLSWFDFVSIDMLAKMQDKIGVPLLSYVSEFLEELMCDTLGSAGEYVRLNDIIRDYVARGSLEIPKLYAELIRRYSVELFSSGDFSEFDYSEKYAAVRVALLNGEDVPEALLIPAHFLGAISQKYKNRKYSDVVELADRILVKGNVEDYIKSQVRFYLCMSLARLGSNRFLQEIQKVRGADHNYIFGFYYRRNGRYADALKRLEMALGEQKWVENAKREMVIIYNIMEEYDKALDMARGSYRAGPNNPINIQAYFEVLINLPRTANVLNELSATLESISRVNTEKGEEVACCMRGQYAFHVEKNVGEAYKVLDEGIERFPGSPYPLLAKLEVAVSIKHLYDINACISKLRSRDAAGYQGKVQIEKAEILAMALSGQKAKALSRIDSELGFLFPSARERFRSRIATA